MNEARKQKLIDTAFVHYRKVGFPYPTMKPHELWAEFFKLQDSQAKINKPHKLKIVNGTQICSNFRPAAAKAIYEKYATGKKILDPSTGYGGRLLGFLSLDGGAEYVGIDPAKKTHLANSGMAEFFGATERVRLINKPFEDVELAGDFQLAFTSPPYFSKEIYSAESTQSCHRYPTFDSWLVNFWQVSIEKIARYLTSGGKFVVNIQNVKIRQKAYPLVEKTKLFAAQAGLRLVEELALRFSGFGSGLEKFKTEPIMVFEKRGQ